MPKLSVIALLAAGTLALAPASAGAQQETGDIMVVDWDRALNESMAGQDIRRQVTEIQDRARAEVQQRDSDLSTEEAEIARQRSELGAVEFESRVRDFEEKVARLRSFVQAHEEEVERAFQRALGALADEARQVLGTLMQESGATHVFDRRVLLAHSTSEATELLIERIDARIQRISVDYEPPELE